MYVCMCACVCVCVCVCVRVRVSLGWVARGEFEDSLVTRLINNMHHKVLLAY
jgi:hypothetical protein